VTVIGDRAFAFTRNVRKGDFRASGGGDLCYDLSRLRPECVRIALDVTRKVGAQSLAFDFLLAPDGCYRIGEICYAYNAKAVHDCMGHWDAAMNWHEGQVWPQDAIIEDLLADLRSG
jgi:glutathione synthase/RimK-type ligase-like ATP-grasp enzyme